MEGSKFLLIGFVLTICAVIFQLIGLASPYWISFEFELAGAAYSVYTGLWKYCTVVQEITTCVDSTDNIKEDWFKAVRAMTIMGFLALVVALVMTILKLFVMKEKDILQFAAVATAFAAAVFILISIAITAAKVKDDPLFKSIDYSYHFAFAFCILAMLAAIGAGCIILVDALKKKT
uniref:Uncharacterized protein LOC111138023 n=1 Tax=Crassostrea virginica TaxID=6565 RepID=A0A8B8EZQ3_CRAVI|nr:uncharacterized protein LOC111138023 [Crassostrea virginica]